MPKSPGLLLITGIFLLSVCLFWICCPLCSRLFLERNRQHQIHSDRDLNLDNQPTSHEVEEIELHGITINSLFEPDSSASALISTTGDAIVQDNRQASPETGSSSNLLNSFAIHTEPSSPDLVKETLTSVETLNGRPTSSENDNDNSILPGGYNNDPPDVPDEHKINPLNMRVNLDNNHSFSGDNCNASVSRISEIEQKDKPPVGSCGLVTLCLSGYNHTTHCTIPSTKFNTLPTPESHEPTDDYLRHSQVHLPTIFENLPTTLNTTRAQSNEMIPIPAPLPDFSTPSTSSMPDLAPSSTFTHFPPGNASRLVFYRNNNVDLRDIQRSDNELRPNGNLTDSDDSLGSITVQERRVVVVDLHNGPFTTNKNSE